MDKDKAQDDIQEMYCNGSKIITAMTTPAAINGMTKQANKNHNHIFAKLYWTDTVLMEYFLLLLLLFPHCLFYTKLEIPSYPPRPHSLAGAPLFNQHSFAYIIIKFESKWELNRERSPQFFGLINTCISYSKRQLFIKLDYFCFSYSENNFPVYISWSYMFKQFFYSVFFLFLLWNFG